jgi:signal transduction histidine kinase
MTNSGQKVAVTEVSRFSINLVCVLGVDGCFQRLNEDWASLLGSRHIDLLGTLFIDLVHQDDVEHASAAFKQLLAGDAADVGLIRLKRSCGDTVGVDWLFVADSSGVGGLVGIGQITVDELSAADSFLNDSAALLDKPQKSGSPETGCELDSEEMKFFTDLATHDFRAPIRAIDGFAKILEESYVDQLDPTARDYIRRIVVAAGKMNQLVDGVMGYLCLAVDCESFRKVDLNQIVRDVTDALACEVPKILGEVRSEKLPFVHGDANQLRMLFVKLIRNGLVHNTDSCPVVHVSWLSPGSMAKDVFGAGQDRVMVSVSDNGVGIEAKYQHEVFGVFRKLGPPSETTGIGLGLPVSLRIVKRHGGVLRHEAGAGGGSRFIFDLPAAEPASKDSERTAGSNDA